MGQNSIKRGAARLLANLAPSVLRFLARRTPIERYQWPLLAELTAAPKGRRWLESRETPTRTRKGFRIFTLPNDLTSDFIKLHGKHESGTERFVLDHLEPGATFLDVGANIGYYSLLAASAGGSKVVAFEPQKPLADLLRQSIDINNLGQLVRVEQLALSNEAATMRIRSCPGNSGHAQLTANNDDGVEPYTVSVVAFDGWSQSQPIGRTSVCKIDTEGAELNVLKGMARMLARDRPALVVELVDAFLTTFGASESEVRTLVRGFGYRDVSSRYATPGDNNGYFVFKNE